MKCIPIQMCITCPHIRHRGAFGSPAYVPWCGATEKNLPYTESSRDGRSTAHPTGVIPDSCPLPDMPEVKA